MAFMEPEIVFGYWCQVETSEGTETIPADIVALPIEVGETVDRESEHWAEVVEALSPYLEGDPREVRLVEGWGCRMSAPGYMDCTPWSLFDTQADAEQFLTDLYGDEEEGA